MIAHHDETIYCTTAFIITCTNKTKHLGFKYLRSLINYCNVKMAETEQLDMTVYRSKSTDNNLHPVHEFCNTFSTSTTRHLVLDKVLTKFGTARQFASQTDIVRTPFNGRKHRTDFIYSTIRICHQQQSASVAHKLFYHRFQGNRRFASSRRTNKQEKVLSLFGTKNNAVNLRIQITSVKIDSRISLRLATIENADQILVVEDGRIAESGTHDELVKQNGVYRRFTAIREQAELWCIAAE